MLYGRMSLSAGGSAFETDGFRHNNDDKTKLADVYGQIAITPKISLQTEYRYRDTDHGDLALEFDPLDPATFSLVQRRDIDQDVLRVGLRVSPAPHSDIILSDSTLREMKMLPSSPVPWKTTCMKRDLRAKRNIFSVGEDGTQSLAAGITTSIVTK
jgi:hypothetical protein